MTNGFAFRHHLTSKKHSVSSPPSPSVCEGWGVTKRDSLLSEIEARMPDGILTRRPNNGRATAELFGAVTMIWGSWAALVFVPLPVIGRLAVAVVLGASLAHGLLLGHNANHGAMFSSDWAGRLASFAMSGMAVSAPTYRQRHTRRHHSHRDDTSLADDLVSTLMRFSPQHPLRSYHRFQHIYVWPAIAIYYVNIWFVDLRFLFTGKDGRQQIETPTVKRALAFVPPKLIVTTVLVGVPAARFSAVSVIAIGSLAMAVAGVTTGVLNLIGHASELNRVPDLDPSVSPADARVLRILAVAADLSPDRRFTRWFLGQAHGVHVAHHLWPRLCAHALYPATVSLRQSCAELGLEYHSYPSITAGVRSVTGYLKEMGRPVTDPTTLPAPVLCMPAPPLRAVTLKKVCSSRPYLAVVSRL